MGENASWQIREAIEREARLIAGEGPVTVRLVRSSAARWASMAFDGQEHRLELEIAESAAPPPSRLKIVSEELISRLHDADLPLAGHALVDLQFMGIDIEQPNPGNGHCRLTFKALTVSD